MATLTKAITNDLFDQILPTFGNPRVHIPRWDEGQKMFICDEFESQSGKHYYKGIRFCERLVIVEKVGLFHNWTYIDGLELYAFNGSQLELVQKRDYEKTFREEAFIRSESENMVRCYFQGALKVHGGSVDQEHLTAQAKTIVDNCYKSFLDNDFNLKLTQIVPRISMD